MIKYNESIKKEETDFMDKRDLGERIDELYEIILRLKTKEDCAMLFADLCTYTEVEQMAAAGFRRRNCFSKDIPIMPSSRKRN